MSKGPEVPEIRGRRRREIQPIGKLKGMFEESKLKERGSGEDESEDEDEDEKEYGVGNEKKMTEAREKEEGHTRVEREEGEL